MSRYTNRSTIRNEDLYVAVYDSIEAAEAEDRDGLLTVQAFDSGDFPVMKSLDEVSWQDGELLTADGEIVPFYCRVVRRKPEKPAPKRKAWGTGTPSESQPS